MMKRHSHGLTLLQLLVICVILGIMSAFAMMKMTSSSDYNVSPIAEQLKRNIRYTQLLAMSLNVNYTITITASGYSISPTPPECAVSVTMPTGVTLTAATLTFNASGDPGLGSALNITVTGPNYNRTITVSRETGYVDG